MTSNFYVGVLSAFNDNLFLDTTGRQQVFLEQLVPHFDLDYTLRRFTLTLDYTGDYSWYSKGGERLKNTLHYSRLNSSWQWHRDFTLQLNGDVSDRPIDLSRGGGVISSAQTLGDFFRPPAVNSVLVRTAGANQSYYRQLNSRTYLEASLSATSATSSEKRYVRDLFSYGPSGQLLYTWSFKLDTAFRGSVVQQDYVGNYNRKITRAMFESNYRLSPKIRLRSAFGVEGLHLEQPDSQQFNSSSLYLELGVGYERVSRTRLDLEYTRRFLTDIQAQVFRVDELALSFSHALSRRLMVTAGVYTRSLKLIGVEDGTADWISGSDCLVRYTVTKKIQPVLNFSYVVNRGRLRSNDFDNFRINTGLRYYFITLN